MENKIRVLSLLAVLIFLVSNHFCEALIDRSITVNKGQSGFFSLNADDLVNEDVGTDNEPTPLNPELTSVVNSTLQAPARIYGVAVDPNKALEPRNIFQRIEDIIVAIVVTIVMMIYNTISTYLLSYRQLFRIFKNIPGEDLNHPLDVPPVIHDAAL